MTVESERVIRAFIITSLLVGVLTVSVSAQNGSQINWPRYQDMAVDLMQQYLRVNTSNPPGNEIEAARFLKKIFDQHGIENEIFEYKPGRANIIARLKGNGSKRPIILLSHTDVVTAEPASWEVDPFAGIIKNNSISVSYTHLRAHETPEHLVCR